MPLRLRAKYGCVVFNEKVAPWKKGKMPRNNGKKKSDKEKRKSRRERQQAQDEPPRYVPREPSPRTRATGDAGSHLWTELAQMNIAGRPVMPSWEREQPVDRDTESQFGRAASRAVQPESRVARCDYERIRLLKNHTHCYWRNPKMTNFMLRTN